MIKREAKPVALASAVSQAVNDPFSSLILNQTIASSSNLDQSNKEETASVNVKLDDNL